MIHYHGTPIGGSRQDAARFLIGRHALVPFSYPGDIGIVADVCQSFCLDNGAFTIWKKGGQLDIDGYHAWVAEWSKHPNFDFALIPDVIDGDAEANDILIDRFKSAGLEKYGAPVWHMHESIDRLQQLCSEWRVVALGSSGQWASVGTDSWWVRMSEAMDAICDAQGRPPAKLHGLRMLDPIIFTRLPLSSADSTNAAVNGGSISRFGMYTPPTAAQRAAVIAERIESHNSAAVWSKNPQTEFLL